MRNTLRGVLIHLKIEREKGTLRPWFISDLTKDKFLVVTDQFFEGKVVCAIIRTPQISRPELLVAASNLLWETPSAITFAYEMEDN